MVQVNLELPTAIHKYAKQIAKQNGVTIMQLISTALAEKMAALDAEAHMKKRAKRANRKAYDDILANAPARPPLKGDELPD